MAPRTDIVLDENAFNDASSGMAALRVRAQTLQRGIEAMYRDMAGALDTPAGKELSFAAEKVLVKPIGDLLIVIKHVSDTLAEIIGTGHYKDVFIKFTQLNDSIRFD